MCTIGFFDILTDNSTISLFALWDDIIPAIILKFVASWICSTAHLVYLCLCMTQDCVQVKEEMRMSETSSGWGVDSQSFLQVTI